MNTAPLSPMDELLADRAVQGLSPDEAARLATLLRTADLEDDESLDFAAASLDLAIASRAPGDEALPERLRARLEIAAEGYSRDSIGRTRPSTRTDRPRAMPTIGVIGRLGWVAAAAGFALAGWAMWTGGVKLGPTSLAGLRAALVSSAPDVVTIPWGDFVSLDEAKQPPELAGVSGDVVWSDSKQEGYMRLVGLKPNDPRVEQYQLWIVDAQRGLDQRVSGGVFDVNAAGEVVVAISKPPIPVSKAAAFAVTIEKPGGTWVSDMKRRACLAMRKS